MSDIIEKYSRALKLYRDDGISVPVFPSEMRNLIADFLALQEHCAALERQNQHLLTVTKQQARRVESMEAGLTPRIYEYDPPGYECYGCKSLARRVEDAETRLSAFERDAARYRWLVNCNDAGVWSFLAGMDDDQIDEAIDEWIEGDSESNGE